MFQDLIPSLTSKEHKSRIMHVYIANTKFITDVTYMECLINDKINEAIQYGLINWHTRLGNQYAILVAPIYWKPMQVQPPTNDATHH